MFSVDWLQIGVMVATVLGTMGVFLQARIAARQATLQEIDSARREREAWVQLNEDWKRTQVVAHGPRSGVHIDPEIAVEYGQRLNSYRDAHLAAWDPVDDPELGDAVWAGFEQAIARESVALGVLNVERASVALVLSHLFQVATFHFERKISISAIYSAAGPDLVAGFSALQKVTRFPPDYLDGCISSVYEEARYWRTLDLDELSSRLGWASSVGPSISSLGRIDALLAALTVYSYNLGDLDELWEGSLALYEVGDPRNLARIWKAIYPMGRRRAWVLCFRSAYVRGIDLTRHRHWWGRFYGVLAQAWVALKGTFRAQAAARTLSRSDRWLPSAHELRSNV